MLFRINGEMPLGNLEITCICGTWNQYHIDIREEKVLRCKECNRTVLIWQQIKHWHIRIQK